MNKRLDFYSSENNKIPEVPMPNAIEWSEFSPKKTFLLDVMLEHIYLTVNIDTDFRVFFSAKIGE